MSTASNTSSSSAIAATYARGRSRSGGRRVWGYVVGAVALVAVVWFSIRNWPFGALAGSGAGGNESTYVVRPMELNITLTEDGELKPKRSIELKNEVEGQTSLVFIIEESTQVKKGDLLVELASDAIVDRITTEQLEVDRIEAELQSAESELEIQRNQNASDILKAQTDLEIARKELDKYLEGDFIKEQRNIQIQIEETLLRIERKNDELADNEYLVERRFVSEAKLEPIRMELATLDLQLEQNRLAERILLEYEKPMAVKQKESVIQQAVEALKREEARAISRQAQAEARVEQYRKQLEKRRETLARKQQQLEKCRIVAPTDGIVRYPDVDSYRGGDDNALAVGSKVFESQTLVVLPDTSQLVVSTRVHEADRHKIELGNRCMIKVPAAPGVTLTGHVAKIATFADTTNRWLNPELKEHTTEILLDDTSAPVSPGDSAEVQILIDRISDVLAVPVQCVYSRGPKNYVFRKAGNSVTPVEIALGASNESFVEVASGLQPGDRVMMIADERLLAMLPVVDMDERPDMVEPPTERPANGQHSQPPPRPAGAAAANPQTPKPEGGRPAGERGRTKTKPRD